MGITIWLGERLHLIRHETNRGVGGAIATGYKWCRDHEMDVEVETEKR